LIALDAILSAPPHLLHFIPTTKASYQTASYQLRPPPQGNAFLNIGYINPFSLHQPFFQKNLKHIQHLAIASFSSLSRRYARNKNNDHA
jgi:hypothetical protein